MERNVHRHFVSHCLCVYILWNYGTPSSRVRVFVVVVVEWSTGDANALCAMCKCLRHARSTECDRHKEQRKQKEDEGIEIFFKTNYNVN